MEKSTILQRPICNLGLSANFCSASRLMGFSTLQQVVDAGPRTFFEKEGFSHVWLGELSRLLIEHDMIHLLQPI